MMKVEKKKKRGERGRKEEKREKGEKNKKENKREKINKNYDKILYLRGRGGKAGLGSQLIFFRFRLLFLFKWLRLLVIFQAAPAPNFFLQAALAPATRGQTNAAPALALALYYFLSLVKYFFPTNF